jgi:hypothetical protein
VLFVGIDLAERHSAAVAVNDAGTPIWESTFDAGPKEKPPRPFVHMQAAIQWWSEILGHCLDHGDFDIVWAVEHVHHHAIDSTPVLRLQGGLLMLMAMSEVETHLVTAHEWQNFFGYSKKLHNNSKTWAKEEALKRGYEPGMTLPGKKLLAKPKTDLIDARMIAEWIRSQVLCLTPVL